VGLARSFKRDARMEKLIRLREERPDVFDESMTPGLRPSLAHYSEAKRAHQEAKR
jgi:hypothetical protein